MTSIWAEAGRGHGAATEDSAESPDEEDLAEESDFSRDLMKLTRCHTSLGSNCPSTKVAAGIGVPSIP